MKINLSKDEIFFIEGDARGVSIGCDRGFLWVTQPNDDRDHILKIGKAVTITQKGKVGVVAFKKSIVSFSKPVVDSNKKVMEGCGPLPVRNRVTQRLRQSVSTFLYINVSHKYRRVHIKI